MGKNKVKNEQKRNSHTYRMATSLGLSYNNCKILLISSSFCKVRYKESRFFVPDPKQASEVPFP